MNYGLARNLSCRFLKFGDATLMSDKLEPKAEKCIFIGYPKTLGILLPQIRRQDRCCQEWVLSRKGVFLKEVSGSKVELDEVIVPPLELESSTSQKEVPVIPTPTREEVNDDDHETSDQVTTELRRSTRTRSAPELCGNPVLEVMLLYNGEPTNYEEVMMGPDSNKRLEAMKSEKGSMYENL